MEKINHLKKDRKKKHQKKKKKIDKVPTLFPELFITAKISLNQTFIQISIPPNMKISHLSTACTNIHGYL